jgi:predicted amidohydrolase
MTRAAVLLVLLSSLSAAAADGSSLRVAVVQMTLGVSLTTNRDRIVNWISRAAEQGARVAVFPEGALSSRAEGPDGEVAEAVHAIGSAARTHKVYVLFGGWTWSERHRRNTNWMKVIAPDGNELLHYDKLWEVHDASTPGLFSLDGVPASAIICSDRWLRAVEDLAVHRGAQISFELSNNFDSEWVPDLEWYWYVPRALRNSVYVVVANTSNRTPGKPEPGADPRPRHGHSAVIAPDGTLLAAAADDLERMLVTDLDLSRADRSEALARGANTAIGPFWKSGLDLIGGRSLRVPSFVQKDSAATDLTVAAAQIEPSKDISRNVAAVVASLTEAARRNVDLVVFPELVLTGGVLDDAEHRLGTISEAARANEVAAVVGLPRRVGNEWRNAAVVFGPDGKVLTTYDQIAAREPFSAGERIAVMWFSVKGVPGVVTIGREALWNEIAELAAVAGARLHVNLSREPIVDSDAALRRRQVGAALSSFMTLNVMANEGGYSAIWEDLTGREETRAAVRQLPPPRLASTRVFSAFSANLAAEAGDGPALITARVRIPGRNVYHPQRTANFHPAMDAWYKRGAEIITGVSPERLVSGKE